VAKTAIKPSFILLVYYFKWLWASYCDGISDAWFEIS